MDDAKPELLRGRWAIGAICCASTSQPTGMALALHAEPVTFMEKGVCGTPGRTHANRGDLERASDKRLALQLSTPNDERMPGQFADAVRTVRWRRAFLFDTIGRSLQ